MLKSAWQGKFSLTSDAHAGAKRAEHNLKVGRSRGKSARERSPFANTIATRPALRVSCRGMVEQLDGPHLPAVGPIAELSEEDRGALSSYGEFRFADDGDLLITQGDSHGRLFFIISGVLHAVRRDSDREVLLGAIRKGEWVGEVDLFDPVSAMCSVIVVEEAQYWTISRPNLEDFINNYPQAGVQLVISLASLLSRRLRSVTRRLMEEAELAIVRASLLVES
jgi:CRP-like cAMP-binding protein